MSRRKARERALQILFQVDMGGVDPRDAIKNMDESFGPLNDNVDFVEENVFGTLANLEFIDKTISGISQDWNIKRMASVDRNLIRMAFYEIFFRGDIPNNVSVNEAVELGKAYGGEESARFINGILGKVLANPDKYKPEILDNPACQTESGQCNTPALP
jgi:N utilization substance protein B